MRNKSFAMIKLKFFKNGTNEYISFFESSNDETDIPLREYYWLHGKQQHSQNFEKHILGAEVSDTFKSLIILIRDDFNPSYPN